MTLNTDASDADSPDADYNDAADAPNSADDDSAYPKLIQLSLYNRNRNRKISPNTKKTIK